MLHRLFVPGSKKRASILSVQSLIIFNVLFLSLVAGRILSKNYTNFNILGFATNITLEEVLVETNKERESNGLSTLKLSPILSKAAERKAQDMFEDGYWNHIAPDGKTPWDFMFEENYSYTYAGENLAKDFMKSNSVVKAWMNSPSHRDNMLNSNYTEIGLAVVDGVLEGEETTLVVQMFGTPDSKIEDTVADIPQPVHEPEVFTVEGETTENIQTNNNVGFLRDGLASVSTDSREGNMVVLNKMYVLYAAYTTLGLFTLALITDGVIAFRNKHLRLTGNTLFHLVLFISALIFVLFINSPKII